ncbi:hypothetical protein C2E21_1573 [Chlorella sorokiniana]|uniref:Uncharacterized protein n=1 Tax=Chlorella sorokiniana TaxID=3076 RepID=A0A2P6U1D3_CHLSO|nr:hypothetical protein C2E21_1573 [Chlorella sorokiniana]|eukprot:PRW60124.1 hypothetical protein C2E21_1573 [Chlorella sorokiniana]
MAEMSSSQQEQLGAARAQIAQLQAADLPSALQGLLQQASTQLKPPRAGAPAATATAAAAAASRPALVLGLLLVLERASALAQQQRDLKLVKVGLRADDAHTQLAAAFQKHDWLWQLLLRKHLPDVLQHPAAAQRLLGALATLPARTQARAYRLWWQQLAAQPAALAVPLQLQLALLEQLRQCFTVRSLDLELPGASELPGQTAQQGSAGSEAAAAAAAGAGGEALTAAEVHVALREQLPPLLQLLLLVACSGGEAATSAAAAAGQPGEGGSSGRGSANAPPAPSLSTVQSAVVARRDPRRRGGSAVAASQAARPASALASSSETGALSSSRRGGILDSVLRHAVLLISRLSDPDALHEMLGIQLRRAGQGPAHGGGSGDEAEEEDAGQEEPQREMAGAAAAGQQQLLSRRDAERISTAAALIEVCLDGMLALPPLATAVHQQLHSKGNSNAAAVCGEAADGAVAEAAQRQQQQDAAAELRTTAGLMLGMHRELSRMLADHQQQLQGGIHNSAAAAKLRQPAPLLSLPACQQLLCVLADTHAGAGGAAGGPSTSGQQQGSGAAGPQFWAAAERPPAVLLVPPQLAVQGIELVRRAVEAGGPSIQPTAAAAEASSWRVAMVAQVAAIYTACYQAIWGAKVLQSAEAYQLLLSAARLRRLLRPADGTAAAPAAADDEAAAEAALLAENAVGNRRRRQRSAAHELPSLGVASKGKAAAGAALPAAKRIKTERGSRPSSTGGDGSAVAELLQLFSSPAAKPPASGSEQGQQQRTAGRKRITPVAVSQQQEQQPAQPQEHQQQQAEGQPQASSQQHGKPARKRIVPQHNGPASGSKLASADPKPSQQGSGASAAAASTEQQGEDGMAGMEAAPSGWQQGQRRIIISKAADMTEEQQEEMWAAYIADKEFLAEMLGDADYQRWFDEAAHPLRKQRQRPGGLEAAWAAVLGGRSAGSIVQQQLPRTLLEASMTMRWDAAAAACLGLLAALLRGAAANQSSVSIAATEAGAEPGERQQSEVEQLLQGAFSRQQLEVGARVATRILGITGATSITGTIQAAQRSPAGGSLVLLAAQMLGLAQGQNYFQQQAVSGLSVQGVPVDQQRATSSGVLVAPPLLEAYAQLLAVLLPHAQQEAAASPATPGAAQLTQLAKKCHPLSVTAQMAEHLLRLPPPLQHMLAPGCTALLRVAAAGRNSDAQQAAQQHAALLWMLVQPRQACVSGTDGGVELPADCPAWLQEEALLLERSCSNFHQHRSNGHAMLLGPAPEVQRAAALELLLQLRLQLDMLQQQGGSAILPADVLVVAADACHAAMQRLLLESQAQRRRQLAEDGSSDAESDDDEEQQGEPLLLGHPAVAEVAALTAVLCDVGATAAAFVATALDAAAAHSSQAQQQQQQRKGRPQQPQQAQQQPQPDSQACAAAAEAASMLVLCNQLVEPADQLLQSGCLPPAAHQRLEAACELLDAQGQAVSQLSDGLPPSHPLTTAIETAMADAPALWQPAAEEEQQAGSDGEVSGGSDGEAGPARPASQQGKKKAGSSNTASSGKADSRKQQAAAKPKERSERQPGRRRRMGEVRNPAVRAMLAEDGGAGLDDDDLSDLEDFLVFNPERDYDAFFKRHFWQARGSDSEEEEDAGVAEAAQGEEGPAAAERAGHDGGGEASGGAGTGKPAEPQHQTKQRQQPKQQRQRPPAKSRDRPWAPPKQQQQQQAAVREQRQPVLGSVAAAAAAAGAAAAAKRQGSSCGHAGGKAQPKRKR